VIKQKQQLQRKNKIQKQTKESEIFTKAVHYLNGFFYTVLNDIYCELKEIHILQQFELQQTMNYKQKLI
jgi:hypothetical protein